MNATWRSYWLRWLSRRIPPANRVQLRQKQIFIIPTKVGAAFGLALALMLLAAINYQNSLAFGLTFLLFSLLLITILHTYRNLSGLTLSAARTAHVFVGEVGRFRVHLNAERHAHQAIALAWPGLPPTFSDVAGGTSTEVELNVPAMRRGWLRPGRLRVESRFPLGALVAWSQVDLDLALLVYPQPLPGDLPVLPGLALAEEEQGQRVSGQGVDDYQGLKTYQPGDSKRRLHWKAYSRGHGLLVKDFSSLSGRDLCLDFMALGGDLETRLSLLCHWVLTLSESQQPFSLQLPDNVLSTATGEQHRDACLRALALFGAVDSSDSGQGALT